MRPLFQGFFDSAPRDRAQRGEETTAGGSGSASSRSGSSTTSAMRASEVPTGTRYHRGRRGEVGQAALVVLRTGGGGRDLPCAAIWPDDAGPRRQAPGLAACPNRASLVPTGARAAAAPHRWRSWRSPPTRPLCGRRLQPTGRGRNLAARPQEQRRAGNRYHRSASMVTLSRQPVRAGWPARRPGSDALEHRARSRVRSPPTISLTARSIASSTR